MTTESWQLEQEAAEFYEALLVPALMSVWAPRVVEAVGVQDGDRVLDVACGTGIVARCAHERIGATGLVTGVDINAGMITVARRLAADIDWHVADVTDLPFPAGSFDRIVCQFGLMFFPDRLTALGELHRVLVEDGRLVVATWDVIEVSPPYAQQALIAGRLGGSKAAAIVNAPFVLGDPSVVAQLLVDSGFEVLEIDTISDVIRYPSVDAVLSGEIDATPLGAYLRGLDPSQYTQMRQEMRSVLGPYEINEGVAFPTAAHIVTARPAEPVR